MWRLAIKGLLSTIRTEVPKGKSQMRSKTASMRNKVMKKALSHRGNIT